MKRIVLLAVTLLVSVGLFAQKGSYKKNTISESWGVAIPIGEADLSYENNNGVGLNLTYQRSFSKSFGLIGSLNLQAFKYDEDMLQELLELYSTTSTSYFVQGKATNALIYNAAVGIFEGTELGNSGVFVEAYEQLALGALKYSVVTIDDYTFDYGTDEHLGIKLGGQIYKMFGGFGIGFNADYTIGFPWACQYANIQFKLVQKF